MPSSTGQPRLDLIGALTDRELAKILAVRVQWVRSYASQIPGSFRIINNRYRFHRQAIVEWLGSLDQLLLPEQVMVLLAVRRSWLYDHADELPGIIRLSRYVRFRRDELLRYVSITPSND